MQNRRSVTVGEYAEALAVHPTTVYRWLREGDGYLPPPAVGVDETPGRRLRILVDAAAFALATPKGAPTP